MNDPQKQTEHTVQKEPAAKRPKRRIVGIIIRVFIVLIILLAGIGGSVYLVKNKPRPKRKPHKKTILLVEVMRAEKSETFVTVEAMGGVVPARSVILTPRVSGAVVHVDEVFIPGGKITAGELLLAIDPRIYEYVLKQRLSDVVRADANLKLEKGRHAIAVMETELLKETLDPHDASLARREPQLASVQAALESAQAALGRAKLDLEWTKIKAPFNGVISTRLVNDGAVVGVNTPLGKIIGTDVFWVEATVPVGSLKWISIPAKKGDAGSLVRIYFEPAWGSSVFRTGHVIQFRPEIETRGKMARIIIEVKDPLSLKPENQGKPRMIINSLVSVHIEGGKKKSVIVLPRAMIRDNNTAWILTKGGILDIRSLTVAWYTRENAYIAEGIKQGELVVVSNLSTPVAGMELKRVGDKTRKTKTDKKEMQKKGES